MLLLQRYHPAIFNYLQYMSVFLLTGGPYYIHNSWWFYLIFSRVDHREDSIVIDYHNKTIFLHNIIAAVLRIKYT